MENEPHERQPRTSITGKNSDCVDALIQEKRRMTVHELSGILNISDGSVKTTIKQHLQYMRVRAQWIPHLLTDEHEYTVASDAIVAVQAGRGLFLDSVMTTVETWLHYLMPENKRSSMQWRHPGSPKPKKSENHVLCWVGYGHHLLGL